MVLEKGSSNEYLIDYKEGRIEQGLGIGIMLDDHLRFKRGQYVGLLGNDNVGKSFFMLWYALTLSTHHNLKWCFWMDENSKGKAMRDLIQMYSGRKFKELTQREIFDYGSIIEDWFSFVDNEQPYTPMQLLEIFKQSGSDGFFIDPFNQLEHKMEYSNNIEFIRTLKRWCKTNKKTVYLAMHPVTSAGRKAWEYPQDHEWAGHPMIPNKSMAEGGKIFANMSDDWINIHRLTKHPDMKLFTMVDIDKVKDSDSGGSQTGFNEQVMLYYNYGLGFKCMGVDPIKRKR